MWSDWQAQARKTIEAIDATFPEGTTLETRRAHLRAQAHTFHMGTSWGKKVWAKHSRAYLEKHGQPPRKVADQPTLPADIIFPWKGESDA